jgi:hypothetical protein
MLFPLIAEDYLYRGADLWDGLNGGFAKILIKENLEMFRIPEKT